MNSIPVEAQYTLLQQAVWMLQKLHQKLPLYTSCLLCIWLVHGPIDDITVETKIHYNITVAHMYCEFTVTKGG